MIVAQVLVTAGGRLGSRALSHAVTFADAGKAKSEYDRVAALIRKRNDRKNDLPETVEIDGGETGSRVTISLDDITSVGLFDFAKVNEHQAGISDAFPHLFRE